MCTFTCTVDEPDDEPKKKKHRISDDDGEESEHNVQGTVTNYMYMYEQIQNTAKNLKLSQWSIIIIKL